MLINKIYIASLVVIIATYSFLKISTNYQVLPYGSMLNKTMVASLPQDTDQSAMQELANILQQNNVPFKNGRIYIPKSVKHVKIDVGLSHNAPMTQRWLEKENDLIVFGFEPNPLAVASIKDSNKAIDFKHDRPLDVKYINDKVYIVPIALGTKHETKDFFVTKTDMGCSSLYKPKSNFRKIEDVIKVDVFRLSTFFKLLPWQQIDHIEYLKIDAQGHDLQIVRGLGDYIDKVVYITLEADYTTYENCKSNTMEQIKAYMASKDFIHVKHKNTRDPTFLNKRLKRYSKVYIEQ